MHEFERVKMDIQSLLNESNIEVTHQTKFEESGVYLLYVDHFTDDKVLPIYVGQSKDIQKRYKAHVTKLLALNHFDSEYYTSSFLSGGSSRYDGSLYITKIFKYMIENNVPLDNLKMIILAKCDHESLDSVELSYIKQLKSSYFGFNQLNSFTYAIQQSRNYPYSEQTLNTYITLSREDMESISKLYNYGYNKFNVNHAFYLAFESDLKRVLEYEVFLNEYYSFRDCYINIFRDIEYPNLLIKERDYRMTESLNCTQIDEQMQKLVELYTSIDDKSKKTFTTYELSKYINEISEQGFSKDIGLRVSKKWYKIGLANFIEVKRLNNELSDFREGYRSHPSDEVKKIENEFRKERYLDIIPNFKYDAFPLNYKKRISDSSDRVNDANEVYVDFLFSSNTRKFRDHTQPFLFKVDISYLLLSECVFNEYYINSYETDKLKYDCENYGYYEYDDVRSRFDYSYYGNPFGAPESFNSIAFDHTRDYPHSSITINTQFNLRYNDLDIVNNELVDFETVLELLDDFAHQGMSIRIKTSEGPSVYKIALNKLLKSSKTKISKVLLKKMPRSNQIVLKRDLFLEN